MFKAINKSIIFLLASLWLWSCSQSSPSDQEAVQMPAGEVLLKINVANPMKGKIYVQRIENGARADFATLDDDGSGKLEQKFTIDEPDFFMVNFYNKQEGMIVLTPETGVLTLEVAGNDSEGLFEARGSKENELMHAYNALEKELKANFDKVSISYKQAQSQEEAEKIAAEYQANFDQKVIDFIKESDGYFVSILPGQLLDISSQTEVAQELANNLKEKFPTSTLVKNFAQRVEGIVKTAVGQEAPEIVLNSPSGETIALSSLRGKFVLIDFWASWCRPCRIENPNVVRMYTRFKDKNFEIFGVSLDKEKKAWEEAIEQDQLSWVHVSDLGFWQSSVVPLYNIEGIPHTVLLNPEGKIVAKDLRGSQLEQKLEELLL